jgi:hypothetical protein
MLFYGDRLDVYLKEISLYKIVNIDEMAKTFVQAVQNLIYERL